MSTAHQGQRPGPRAGGVPAERPIGDRSTAVLDPAECLDLLASTPIGRAVVTDADGPLALPVNHAVHRGAVVFKTVADGLLAAAARAAAPAAFEADELERTRLAGWSVLLRGRAEVVDDAREVRALEDLELHSWLPELARRTWDGATGRWLPTVAYVWVRIRPRSVTGRRTARA
jgi:uncharacterized protein